MPDASSGFMPGGSLTTPDVTACSAEPIAADMVWEPASMPPAAPVGSENSLAPITTIARPSTLDTSGKDRELQTVALQTVDEGRSDAQPDAIHEEVVEQALDEVVQLELHAIERCGHGERGADDDRAGDHAQPVALDARAANPDGEADDEEQQQKWILLKEGEKALHVGSPVTTLRRQSSASVPRRMGDLTSLPRLPDARASTLPWRRSHGSP